MSIMDGVGGVLVNVFSNRTVSYKHVDTDEFIENISAYFKLEFDARESMGDRARFQNMPHFRIDGLVWDERTMNRDIITDNLGDVWEVTKADKTPIGLTTCFVKKIGRSGDI